MENTSLQSLFKNQIGEFSSLFDQSVCRFLESQGKPEEDLLYEESHWQETMLSEEKAIENWKKLLTVNIFCELADLSPLFITQKVRSFENQPWNQSSQYLRALIALNHALAKMPLPTVCPHLLESGAALIDMHEYTLGLLCLIHPSIMSLEFIWPYWP